MEIRPLHDHVIVRRAAPADVKGGIIIPDTAKEKPQEGTVIAVGNGRRTEDGLLTPLDVKSGDRVIFGKYSGTEYKRNGDEWVILRESDILAVLEK